MQVGERNYQINSYVSTYNPRLGSIQDVLNDGAVQEALHHLALHPGDSSAERSASNALRRTGGGKSDTTPGEPMKSTFTAEGSQSSILSILFVSNAEGVQVGNNSRQKNHFAYVYSPTIEVADLLRHDQRFRQQFLDHFSSSVERIGSSRQFAKVLHDSTMNVARRLRSPSSSGTIIRPAKGAKLDISYLDGVTVGWDVRQVNHQQVKVHDADKKTVHSAAEAFDQTATAVSRAAEALRSRLASTPLAGQEMEPDLTQHLSVNESEDLHSWNNAANQDEHQGRGHAR